MNLYVALSLLLLASSLEAKQVVLQLAGSTAGSGPALSGTRGQNINKTIDFPAAGKTLCVSLEGVGDPDEPFFSLSYSPADIPAGTELTLYGQANCTEAFLTQALFPAPDSPYTVIPGTEAGSASPFGTFLGVEFHSPAQGGVIQDGFYNILTGRPYSDLGDGYSNDGCARYLSAGRNNDSVLLATADDTSGLEQLLLQLVKAPNQYTISVPRGRLVGEYSIKNSPAMLEAPDCKDTSNALRLAPMGPATPSTTWLLTNVTQNPNVGTGFGFQANITSLGRLAGECPTSNATSVGIQHVPLDKQNSGDDCALEADVYLIPGSTIDFGPANYAGFSVGGWALQPVSPSYCFNPYSSCVPSND